jgi:hypothetical protein
LPSASLSRIYYLDVPGSLHDDARIPFPATQNRTDSPVKTQCRWEKTNGMRCKLSAVEGETYCVIHAEGNTLDSNRIARHLLALQQLSIDTIEDVLMEGDSKTRSETAFKLLAITGYGPSSTINIRDSDLDLSTLSDAELLARSETLNSKLRKIATTRMDVERKTSPHGPSSKPN